MSRPSNVILITTDQHRYDAAGFNGAAHVHTPQLDALAAEGCVLGHCYASTSVCAPSRATLMTGRYPHLHGQLSNGFTLRSGEQLWWNALARAGYRTAGVGKMHVEPWDDPLGWEDNVRVEGKDWLMGEDAYAAFLRAQGYSFTRPMQAPQAKGLAWCEPRISPVPAEQHIDAFIGDQAVAAIRRAANDARPLAAWISFCSPHHPIDPPQEYADRYADAPVPPHVFSPDELESKPVEQRVMYMWDRIQGDEETRRRAWRYYYATISLVDEQVGRVVEALRETGRYDDTLIVMTADHGEMLFQHGLFDKAFACYDDVYRVPAFVRWPKRVTPGRYDELVEHVDLIPLFYAAAGLPTPQECSGADLLGMLDGVAPARESVLGQHFHMRMLRTRDAKLVNYAGRDYGELYDLRADPHEMRNLWDSADARELRADLLKQLADRLTWSVDPAFRELPQPTNKGAYGDYLKRFDDLPLRFLPTRPSDASSRG